MNIKDSNIAIVHDWFLQKSFGGSEKVTFTLNNFLMKVIALRYFLINFKYQNSKKNTFGKVKYIQVLFNHYHSAKQMFKAIFLSFLMQSNNLISENMIWL